MHPILAVDAGRDLSRFVQVFLARVHVELYFSRRTVHFHLLAARLIGERFVISLRPLYAVSLVEQGPQGEVVAGRIITPGVRAVRVLAETRGGKIAVLTEFPVGLHACVRLALIGQQQLEAKGGLTLPDWSPDTLSPCAKSVSESFSIFPSVPESTAEESGPPQAATGRRKTALRSPTAKPRIFFNTKFINIPFFVIKSFDRASVCLSLISVNDKTRGF